MLRVQNMMAVWLIPLKHFQNSNELCNRFETLKATVRKRNRGIYINFFLIQKAF